MCGGYGRLLLLRKAKKGRKGLGIKGRVAWWLARRYARKHRKEANAAAYYQAAVFQELVSRAEYTAFGKEHSFHEILTYSDYQQAVPVRDYEAFRPYVQRIIRGEKNVLWPGRPKYFAKTSGTTSGVKYIPITAESLPHHLRTARNTLLSYVYRCRDPKLAEGKMIFLSGSPELEKVGGIPTGRLSGIVHHHVPSYLTRNRLPSWKVNVIKDWEAKIEAVVEESRQLDLMLISGIPPWLQNYFEVLLDRTGKTTVKEVFPSLRVVVHGGVNFVPYAPVLSRLVGGGVEWVETYPASEGFIAYQDTDNPDDGLFLNVNAGMFFEFIPVNRLNDDPPPRYSIEQVKVGINYAIVISSNAGLWGYLLGDTVRFTSVNPYRIKVTGRTHHFISAFGEHVIAEEVENALSEASRRCGVCVREFHVAPYVPTNPHEKPRYEWFIEPEKSAHFEVTAFAEALQQALAKQNIYYADLVRGEIVALPRVVILRRGAFASYLKRIGKLGGQNKPPRLANHREMAQGLGSYALHNTVS